MKNKRPELSNYFVTSLGMIWEMEQHHSPEDIFTMSSLAARPATTTLDTLPRYKDKIGGGIQVFKNKNVKY